MRIRASVLACALSACLSLAGYQASAESYVGAFAVGTGVASPGIGAETLSVALTRTDQTGLTGLVVYQTGSYSLQIPITCAVWSSTNAVTTLYASGTASNGTPAYIAIVDVGSNALGDKFSIVWNPNPANANLCWAPTYDFRSVTGKAYAINYL